MKHPWRCVVCDMSNAGSLDNCWYCNGSEKASLYPVLVPNAQQNTPSWDDLTRVLAVEEANRATDRSFEEMKAERIAPYLKRNSPWRN